MLVQSYLLLTSILSYICIWYLVSTYLTAPPPRVWGSWCPHKLILCRWRGSSKNKFFTRLRIELLQLEFARLIWDLRFLMSFPELVGLKSQKIGLQDSLVCFHLNDGWVYLGNPPQTRNCDFLDPTKNFCMPRPTLKKPLSLHSCMPQIPYWVHFTFKDQNPSMYVHFHWVNKQLIGILFLKWSRQ